MRSFFARVSVAAEEGCEVALAEDSWAGALALFSLRAVAAACSFHLAKRPGFLCQKPRSGSSAVAAN